MITALHYEAQLSYSGVAFSPYSVPLIQERQEVINIDLIGV